MTQIENKNLCRGRWLQNHQATNEYIKRQSGPLQWPREKYLRTICRKTFNELVKHRNARKHLWTYHNSDARKQFCGKLECVLQSMSDEYDRSNTKFCYLINTKNKNLISLKKMTCYFAIGCWWLYMMMKGRIKFLHGKFNNWGETLEFCFLYF